MGRRKNRPGNRRNKKKKNNTSKAESCSPAIFIPEEIVVKILSRLPIDSLPRFACVSRQWHCLISNISATKTGSPRVLLVESQDRTAYSFSPHAVNEHQQEVEMKSVYVPWTRNIDSDKDIRNCLGSCNGLVLLCIGMDLFLWNPLTRFFKKMLSYEPLWEIHCLRLRLSLRSGLCYDSTDDEYKAVLSPCRGMKFGQFGSYREEVVVFGFRNKSRSSINFPYDISTLMSGPIVNGKLHWFASKNGSGRGLHSCHQIIYFDAHVDKFEEVPMPEPKRGDRDFIVALGVLDGCLSMSRLGNSETAIEVLVMKNYGVEKSWTILFTVSNYPNSCHFDHFDQLVPLGCTKNGEVLAWVSSSWLLEEVQGRHIAAFNPTDNSNRRISMPKGFYFHPIAYEESLISPTCYD